MEGGSDNDLLSLDQPASTENGDKSLEGEGEKRGKGRSSEFKICVHEHTILPVCFLLASP